MVDQAPSLTSQRVAAHRLHFERVRAPFGDPAAEDRLAADVASSLGSELGTELRRYLQARTAFFDRVLLNALDRGVAQVLVLGAGYDGRSLRYAKAGVKWFEVDHPLTQADKRSRLGRLGVAAPQVTFVPADFRDVGWAESLLAAGYEPTAVSMVLCEGVAVYLERRVLEALLRDARGLCAPASRLAVSFSVAAQAGSDARARFEQRVGAMGEPALTVVGPEEVAALLKGSGWQVRASPERARLAGFVVAEVAAPGRGAP